MIILTLVQFGVRYRMQSKEILMQLILRPAQIMAMEIVIQQHIVIEMALQVILLHQKPAILLTL